MYRLHEEKAFLATTKILEKDNNFIDRRDYDIKTFVLRHMLEELNKKKVLFPRTKA